MRSAWLALLALVVSALAGLTTSVAAPPGGAVDRLAAAGADADDADQLVADDGDDEDEDELDDAVMAAVLRPTATLAAPDVVGLAAIDTPLPRLAVSDLFRPPRFASV